MIVVLVLVGVLVDLFGVHARIGRAQRVADDREYAEWQTEQTAAEQWLTGKHRVQGRVEIEDDSLQTLAHAATAQRLQQD